MFLRYLVSAKLVVLEKFNTMRTGLMQHDNRILSPGYAIFILTAKYCSAAIPKIKISYQYISLIY